MNFPYAPEDHFDYNENHALMLPKTDMGKTSIEVYALVRQDLIKRRKEALLILLSQLEVLKEAIEDYSENPVEKHKTRVEKRWNGVKNLTDNHASYAGMCRYFVRQFIVKNNLQ